MRAGSLMMSMASRWLRSHAALEVQRGQRHQLGPDVRDSLLEVADLPLGGAHQGGGGRVGRDGGQLVRVTGHRLEQADTDQHALDPGDLVVGERQVLGNPFPVEAAALHGDAVCRSAHVIQFGKA